MKYFKKCKRTCGGNVLCAVRLCLSRISNCCTTPLNFLTEIDVSTCEINQLSDMRESFTMEAAGVCWYYFWKQSMSIFRFCLYMEIGDGRTSTMSGWWSDPFEKEFSLMIESVTSRRGSSPAYAGKLHLFLWCHISSAGNGGKTICQHI